MKKIYKYRVRTLGEQTIRMPSGAQILHVAEVGEDLFLWAKVNPHIPIKDVKLSIYGTGMDIDADNLRHIGTVVTKAGLVWHIFINE